MRRRAAIASMLAFAVRILESLYVDVGNGRMSVGLCRRAHHAAPAGMSKWAARVSDLPYARRKLPYVCRQAV